MKERNCSGRSVALNWDLIFPQYGELCGGSIRENEAARLEQKMKQGGILKEGDSSLDWYLELRKFGTTPHGGFGIGFDRFLQFVTGFANIRDVVFMSRTAGTISY